MRKRLLVILVLFTLLVSCATFGIKAPETTEEKINLSVATMTGITKVVTNNLRARIISIEVGDAYFVAATGVRNAVITARSLLASGNDAGALEKWIMINNLVIELNSKYNKYGGVK